VIFSAVPVEGAFRLEDGYLQATNGAPDVVLSMRWWSNENEAGAPGLLTLMEGKPGQGSHGSLSKFDLHNTLIAAGPDFKKGYVNQTPSGNIDVAPTILSILGITPPASLDGRVLTEAFADLREDPTKPTERLQEGNRDLGFLSWHQFIKVINVGTAVYFEEGNGGVKLK
jgi:arylsulfatase A-like enzyme